MQEQSDPRRVSVTEDTLAKVANYLATRPWREVHDLICALNVEVRLVEVAGEGEAKPVVSGRE